jgi:Domain of unknown function (DUF1707)
MPDNSWVDPQDFNVNSRLRASDADRDSAAAVINNALAEGRLTPEEHSDRLDSIFAAKTHAELVPLLDDLPATHGVRRDLASQRPADADLDLARPLQRGSRMVAIFGGVSRKGPWVPEPVITLLTVFGGADLDFRDAVLPGKEIVLRATTVLGGLQVTVPPEMRVVDSGIAILGGREVAGNPAEASSPDAPVLRIEGACVLGGIEVRRKARKPPKPPRALRRGKGVNVSIEANPVPVLRIKSGDKDD